MGAIVKVSDLHKSYGSIHAVRGVSFEIAEGTIFGLLGHNGAGKTTTLEVMEGILAADRGEVEVAGVDVVRHRTGASRMIGVQPQSSDYFENLHLHEILNLFGRIYGLRVDTAKLLARVGLEDRAKSYYSKMSGGQQQRFSIAVGLVNDPQVLFLDEPSTGLDPVARRELWGLIREINRDGTTIVLTTHYMEEAQVLCDRVGIMADGELLVNDSPTTLIERFLAEGNKPVQQVQRATLEDVYIHLARRGLY